MKNRTIAMTALLLVSVATCWAAIEVDKRAEAKKSLQGFQDFVCGWKGVGQLRRGSTRGSWRETGDWAWKFTKHAASLTFAVKDAKYFSAIQLESAGKGDYQLTGIDKNKKSHIFRGRANKSGYLVLTAVKPPQTPTVPARITLRTTAGGKRMVILFERRLGKSERFIRLAEVGYTRVGSGFGQGATYVECVVTGGKGTIPVTYKGKTYYVCCGGCRDLFNEDPAGILAEYAALKKKQKEEKQKKK